MDKKGAIMFFSILVSFIIFSMFGIVSAERGYATAPVPVTTIDLTEQGEDNNIYSWTSKEDQEIFFKLLRNSS